MNGAALLIRTLEKLDCGIVFGIPGIHNLDIYDAMIGSRIRHVTARNESGAGFMADGYGRATGKPGVALVISGPGLTNILTPMGEAMHDSIPMLVISSQIPSNVVDRQTGFLHELKNSTHAAATVAKESRTIPSADLIENYVEEAYRLAATGRPGPVHLEISMDILRDEVGAPVQSEAVVRAADILASAANVCILAGGGAAEAGAELTAVAERLSAAVITSVAGKGVMDERHPLSLGTRIHIPAVHEMVESADAVLAVGTQLSPTDLWEMPLKLRGKFIQIDRDAGAFEKTCPADIGIKADARVGLNALLKKLGTGKKDDAELRNRIAELKALSRKTAGEITGIGAHYGFALEVLDTVREVLPEDGRLFIDMTMPAYVGLSEYPAYRPRTFLHPVGFGTLGYALPAAVGAKLADPGTPVCAFAGDGGFQFTMQELAAACEESITLPLIIWNNAGFGEIRRTEDERHPGRRIAVDNRNPDFVALARSYGIPAYLVSSAGELRSVLGEALSLETPSVIEIRATTEGGN